MNFTVWKYEIPLQDEFTLEMPKGAYLLRVALQSRDPKLWVFVNLAEKETEVRRFRLVGTGNPCTTLNHPTYVGSFTLHNDALVFHLFEEYVPAEGQP